MQLKIQKLKSWQAWAYRNVLSWRLKSLTEWTRRNACDGSLFLRMFYLFSGTKAQWTPPFNCTLEILLLTYLLTHNLFQTFGTWQHTKCSNKRITETQIYSQKNAFSSFTQTSQFTSLFSRIRYGIVIFMFLSNWYLRKSCHKNVFFAFLCLYFSVFLLQFNILLVFAVQLKGIYDLHIEVQGVPLLPWEPPELSYTLTARLVYSTQRIRYEILGQQHLQADDFVSALVYDTITVLHVWILITMRVFFLWL